MRKYNRRHETRTNTKGKKMMKKENNKEKRLVHEIQVIQLFK